MFRAHVLIIALHSLWYHHTYRCDDTRGCVIQFWPPDDEHMCLKHVEAWNKLIVKQKFCASSWLIIKINILRCTVSKTSKHMNVTFLVDVSQQWGFQLSHLMRETSEFGNSKGVYSHQDLPDFTTLPENYWLQSPAAQLATKNHKAYWSRFPRFVVVVRQKPGCSWKGQGQGSSSPSRSLSANANPIFLRATPGISPEMSSQIIKFSAVKFKLYKIVQL